MIFQHEVDKNAFLPIQISCKSAVSWSIFKMYVSKSMHWFPAMQQNRFKPFFGDQKDDQCFIETCMVHFIADLNQEH